MHAASRILCALGRVLGYLLEPAVVVLFDGTSLLLILYVEIERWKRRRSS